MLDRGAQMVSEKHPHRGGHGAPPNVVYKEMCGRPLKIVMDSSAVVVERWARLSATFRSYFPMKMLLCGWSARMCICDGSCEGEGGHRGRVVVLSQ